MISLLVSYILIGLVLMGLAVPLIQRRIKPNSYYGFRTRKMLNNPELWYDINAYSARWMLYVGVLIIVLAIILYMIPDIKATTYTSICTFTLMLGVFFSAIMGYRRLREVESHFPKS